jgi:hypothetical protein
MYNKRKSPQYIFYRILSLCKDGHIENIDQSQRRFFEEFGQSSSVCSYFQNELRFRIPPSTLLVLFSRVLQPTDRAGLMVLQVYRKGPDSNPESCDSHLKPNFATATKRSITQNLRHLMYSITKLNSFKTSTSHNVKRHRTSNF